MFFEKFVDEELNPESFIDSFNNFWCHFPLGNKPYPTDELTATIGIYRKASKLNDRKDTSHKTAKYPKLLGLGEEESVPVTRKEFYDDLYLSVEEAGFTMEHVSETLNPLHGNMGGMSDEDWQKAYETLKPIFIIMRNKGYSNHDLWS